MTTLVPVEDESSVASRQSSGAEPPDSASSKPQLPDFYGRAPAVQQQWVWVMVAVLGGIFVVALVLRLWNLDGYGLWYDEVASIEIARRGPIAILTDRFGGMLVQTPLHYLIVWLTIQPVDPADTSILVRLPSVLAGALTTLVAYGLGKELFGRIQGVLAAALIAVSAVHISHSQDVRPYSMLVLFTALAVYCLVKAQREGTRGWWVAFGASLVAALYISYFTITLFMPAFAPYLLWVLFNLVRRKERRSLKYFLIAVGVAALASVPLFFDLLSVHRTSPELGLLSVRLVLDQCILLLTSTAQLGIGGAMEQVAQWALFLLAAVGVYSAFRERRASGAMLCLLLVFVPAFMLALFKTTNQVFQRYALFVMPFYFLLIANGLSYCGMRIADFRFWKRFGQSQSAFRIRQSAIVTGALGGVVLVLFAVSAYLYFDPQQHRRFSYLPDYRGAAQMLAQHATPQDLIVLADEPALGAAVISFYWKGAPPAPTYDARDPRLYGHHSNGAIYWVVSVFQNNPEFLQSLPSQPGWSDASFLERIVVVKQSPPAAVLPTMERLVSLMEAKLPQFQPVLTLRGTLYQAQGQADKAADYYSRAGEYFPQLGGEFLSTAMGFDERGNKALAMREAITSKFMQPGDPALHRFLAQQLAEQGYQAESVAEQQVADALQPRMTNPGQRSKAQIR